MLCSSRPTFSNKEDVTFVMSSLLYSLPNTQTVLASGAEETVLGLLLVTGALLNNERIMIGPKIQENRTKIVQYDYGCSWVPPCSNAHAQLRVRGEGHN